MAQFDILGATTKAYKVAWVERHYLLRLAAIPFAIRLLCYVTAVQYAPAPADYLRFTLIMLPALLAEGWMLAHFVRLILLGQRWPFKPTGNMKDDLAVLTVRARGVLSGLIVFVLISMGIGVLMAIVGNFIIPYMPQDGATEDVQIPKEIGFLSMVILAFMIWGFRLVWLYIPYAVGADWKSYLLPLRGLKTSFYMIALWCLCCVPTIFVGNSLVGFVAATMGDKATSFAFVIVNAMIHVVTSFVVTAGMTYALFEFFKAKKD